MKKEQTSEEREKFLQEKLDKVKEAILKNIDVFKRLKDK